MRSKIKCHSESLHLVYILIFIILLAGCSTAQTKKKSTTGVTTKDNNISKYQDKVKSEPDSALNNIALGALYVQSGDNAIGLEYLKTGKSLLTKDEFPYLDETIESVQQFLNNVSNGVSIAVIMINNISKKLNSDMLLLFIEQKTGDNLLIE